MGPRGRPRRALGAGPGGDLARASRPAAHAPRDHPCVPRGRASCVRGVGPAVGRSPHGDARGGAAAAARRGRHGRGTAPRERRQEPLGDRARLAPPPAGPRGTLPGGRTGGIHDLPRRERGPGGGRPHPRSRRRLGGRVGARRAPRRVVGGRVPATARAGALALGARPRHARARRRSGRARRPLRSAPRDASTNSSITSACRFPTTAGST